MELRTVDSSVIHAAGYDPQTQTLEIVFNSGRPYRYRNVRPEVYQGLMSAPSKGHYFLAHIRDVYPYMPMGRWRRSARRRTKRTTRPITVQEVLQYANELSLRDRLLLAEQILAGTINQVPESPRE